MPDGIVLLDADNAIVWCNTRFQECLGREDVVGSNFYTALGSPEILGPDYCPFHTVHGSGVASDTTLRVGDNRYCHLHVAPVERSGGCRARDRHGPRRHHRGPAAAEDGRHSPGRLGVGRPDARRAAADVDRGADRVAEVEHPALHQRPAEVRRGRGPPLGPEDAAVGALAVGGHRAGGVRGGCCWPGRGRTA